MKIFTYYFLTILLISFNIREVVFDKSGVFFNAGNLLAEVTNFESNSSRKKINQSIHSLNLKSSPSTGNLHKLDKRGDSVKTDNLAVLTGVKAVVLEKEILSKNLSPSPTPEKIEPIPIKIETPSVPANVEPIPIKIPDSQIITKKEPTPIKKELVISKVVLETPAKSIPKEIKKDTSQNSCVTTSYCVGVYGKKKFKPHKYWKQQKRNSKR